MPSRETTHLEDATLIVLDHRWEVAYWTRRFGTSEDQLREVIARVGNAVENVERDIITKR